MLSESELKLHSMQQKDVLRRFSGIFFVRTRRKQDGGYMFLAFRRGEFGSAHVLRRGRG